jgi:cation transport ATPase
VRDVPTFNRSFLTKREPHARSATVTDFIPTGRTRTTELRSPATAASGNDIRAALAEAVFVCSVKKLARSLADGSEYFETIAGSGVQGKVSDDSLQLARSGDAELGGDSGLARRRQKAAGKASVRLLSTAVRSTSRVEDILSDALKPRRLKQFERFATDGIRRVMMTEISSDRRDARREVELAESFAEVRPDRKRLRFTNCSGRQNRSNVGRRQ